MLTRSITRRWLHFRPATTGCSSKGSGTAPTWPIRSTVWCACSTTRSRRSTRCRSAVSEVAVTSAERRVFALLVGIDAYLPPIPSLWGCRNDIAALEQYLRARVGAGLELRTLYDADATRDAVTAGFREHLG